jgi:hypothetical protein
MRASPRHFSSSQAPEESEARPAPRAVHSVRMPRFAALTVCLLRLCAFAAGPALAAAPTTAGPTIVMPSATPAPAAAAPAPPGKQPAAARGCLPTGNGYLKARIRGALNLDIDWRNAQIECDGGPRSDGSGIRVAFVGPRNGDGRRLRLVFGVNTVREGRSGRALPTNLTLIVEGGQRLYATRGEDRCTVDSLNQQRLSDPGSGSGTKSRSYRIVARGFCVAPASTLDEAEHILVSSFDFAGTAVFGAADFEDPQAQQAQNSGGVNVGR